MTPDLLVPEASMEWKVLMRIDDFFVVCDAKRESRLQGPRSCLLSVWKF